MTLEEKYKRAILALQAVAARRANTRKKPYCNERQEAAAFRDCKEAAYRCLCALGEETQLPQRIKPMKPITIESDGNRCKTCGQPSEISGICEACGNKVEKALPNIRRIIIAKYKHRERNSINPEDVASFAEMLIFHKTKVYVRVRCKPDNTLVVEPPKTE